MEWQNTTWILKYLIMYSINQYSPKIRCVISPARLTKPWQYVHQNVQLGRDIGAISFLAETRYRGDVIRKKRRQKTPLKVNGEKQKNDLTLEPHYSGILARRNVI